LLGNHCGVDFFALQTKYHRAAHLPAHGIEQAASTGRLRLFFLKNNPKELNALYSDVLINVTSFFSQPGSIRGVEAKGLSQTA